MSIHIEPIWLKVRAINGTPQRGEPFYAICDVILFGSIAWIRGLHGILTIKDSKELVKILKSQYNINEINYERKGKWKRIKI